MSQNVVFSEVLHKSNVRIQKKSNNKYSYLKIKRKKGKIDKRLLLTHDHGKETCR